MGKKKNISWEEPAGTKRKQSNRKDEDEDFKPPGRNNTKTRGRDREDSVEESESAAEDSELRGEDYEETRSKAKESQIIRRSTRSHHQVDNEDIPAKEVLKYDQDIDEIIEGLKNEKKRAREWLKLRKGDEKEELKDFMAVSCVCELTQKIRES